MILQVCTIPGGFCSSYLLYYVDQILGCKQHYMQPVHKLLFTMRYLLDDALLFPALTQFF
jgi:hypothetical protein